PMPPRPTSRRSVYRPTVWPASGPSIRSSTLSREGYHRRVASRGRSDEAPGDGTTKGLPAQASVGAVGVMVVSGGRVTGHLLPPSTPATVGRSPTSTILVQDESISRHPATIHPGEPPSIEDAGSRNGTTVQGRRLQPGERALAPLGTVAQVG